jgi:hypothetical protein
MGADELQISATIAFSTYLRHHGITGRPPVTGKYAPEM